MENQQEQAQGYPQSSTITGMNSQKQPSQSSSSPPVMAQQPQLHHLLQQQQQQLQLFWNYQRQEIEQVTDFKNHQLPLARIKKIMKADEDVRMISAEAPVLFAKACEFFILELTIRAWLHAEENKRRTLQKNDIAAAITRTDIFDFLVDIVPRDEIKDEGMSSLVRPGYVSAAPAADHLTYYYPPAANAGVTIGRPAMAMGDPSMYYQAAPVAGGMQYGVPRQPWQQVWQPSQPEPQTFNGNVPAQESTGDDQGQGYDVSSGS